jgi:MoaA/NifB/PqqE/SkfB family radical SAM enzyme
MSTQQKSVELERVVLEVIGGCNYTCQMCPQTSPGRGKDWTRKMPLSMFEDILDEIVPKYGTPQINLEGSGEPTLAKDLHLYIEAVKKRGLKAYIYTNGFNLTDDYMRGVLDAGIDFIRCSVIGYNQATYAKWMDTDSFYHIRRNLVELQNYAIVSGSDVELSTYHLITDNNQIPYEVSEYRQNFIRHVQSKAYIWKMHNWSGNYDPQGNARNPMERKTCGRPFGPELTIRAGGNGKRGAVTPCCQTLGPPNESKSVLGHFEDQSFEEIFWGEQYEALRLAHEEGRFDDIDYCSQCDFLYDDPEVLVWSNDDAARTKHMLGTTFSLRENIIVSS